LRIGIDIFSEFLTKYYRHRRLCQRREHYGPLNSTTE
jgi:hypothetical protein